MRECAAGSQPAPTTHTQGSTRWAIACCLLLVGCTGASASNGPTQEATTDRVREHVEYLASDEMRGRKSGTAEYDRAADYVVTHLQEQDVGPLFGESYRQPITVESGSFAGTGSVIVRTNDTTARFGEQSDVAFMTIDPAIDWSSTRFALVDVGLGIHEPDVGWDDYAGVDLTNRCALLTLDTPVEQIEHLPRHIRIRYSDMMAGPAIKAWSAFRNGASCMIAYPSATAAPGVMAPMRSPQILRQNRVTPGAGDVEKPAVAVVVSREAANLMLEAVSDDSGPGESRSGESDVSFEATWTSDSTIHTANVGARIEGTDPELRDEVIVLTAHLDGQGMNGRQVMNSANDNASSVAALLEAARSLAGQELRRTVYFLFTALEEDGLMGARHFVDHPPEDGRQLRLVVNMEMVGKPRRSGSSHEFRVSGRVAEGVESIVRSVERSTPGVEFDYLFRSDDDGRRIFRNSDHVHFFLRGIPTLYFYGGPEDYHQPTDDPEGINYEKVATMAELLVSVVKASDAMDRLPGWP